MPKAIFPRRAFFYFGLVLAGLFCASCRTEPSAADRYFELLPANRTGIDFENTITETPEFNILNFHYIYNGGGVGTADFDGNGLPDLVFTGNQVSSKIYLNRGDFRFEDISEVADFTARGWNTGVSIVDLNEDGLPDIYLSTGGLDCSNSCSNQLFIHQGVGTDGLPRFREMAEAYGLADPLYTQQAAFFDYDRDGDLDVYLLRNAIETRDKNAPTDKSFLNKLSQDRLLENRFSEDRQHPFFHDVTDSTGIGQRGYGLGVTVSDFNSDGLPDLYVANDFLSEDRLYLSDKNRDSGRYYREASAGLLKHQSYNAMGVDAADVDGDLLPDIVVLDMLPEYNERRKTMLGFMNYYKYELAQRQGYAAQYIRNTLQLNSGTGTNGQIPFSEVGYAAGISATDWSWTPLLADFDNDGDRDLYVTNGYGKDITDLDFINYSAESNAFGSREELMRKMFADVQRMPNVELPNYYFENRGAVSFTDRSSRMAEPLPSISNGAIYVDLDGDGDLDLVTNNINSKAFLLENRHPNSGNFLRINFQKNGRYTEGIGYTVQVYLRDGAAQQHYQAPVRGYLSSVEPTVHFGLGKAVQIDSVVVWTPGRHHRVVIGSPGLNQTLTVNLDDLQPPFVERPVSPLLQQRELFPYRHQENRYLDYDAQALLLRQHSRSGPCLAVADIDGRAGEELFIGGARGIPGHIYSQQPNGNWTFTELAHAESEDTDALFFDADGDGDLDLAVASGGSEFSATDPALRDRIYLNDGWGNFSFRSFPAIRPGSSSCVVDLSTDEDRRVFFGSELIPQRYPEEPVSQLLQLSTGKAADQLPDTISLGLVTDALRLPDPAGDEPLLVVVGEWRAPGFYRVEEEGLRSVPVEFVGEHDEIRPLQGLWSSIASADLDADGDLDLILGNLGENTRLRASVSEPLSLYTGDYDHNGSPDPLVGMFFPDRAGERKAYPLHARDDVVKQLPAIKNRYRSYREFGEAGFREVLNDTPDSEFLYCTTLRSVWLENLGRGRYRVHDLPEEAQRAPIRAILATDVDRDGSIDLLLSGNDYGAESNGGRADSFNGLLLRGDGRGTFEALPSRASGFFVPEDGRDLTLLQDQEGRSYLVAAQNSGPLLFFEFDR